MPRDDHGAGDIASLEQFGQGVGFFRSYADCFWKSTRMELDLVHQEGDTWKTVAGRIRGVQCRDLALDRSASVACECCFRDTCDQAVRHKGFQSSTCHAGRRFSVRSIGECGGRRLLLLAGRVSVGRGAAKAGGDRSPVEYDAAIRLIELSLPYLKSQLRIEAMVADRQLSPIVRRACRHIDRHYRDKLGLGVVAAACRVSEDHLSHAFSQQTGQPLTRYISAVRIGHAMFLLGETQMDVTEICFEVGFQSISQFNRAFRAMRGMSPTAYRKKHQA